MSTTEIMAIVGGLLIGYRIVGKLIGRKHENPTESGQEDGANNTWQKSGHSRENQKPFSYEFDNNANDQASRIFSCPTCNQKIRVQLPLPDGIGKCTRCITRFHIYVDDEGNLYITKASDKNNKENEDSAINSLKDCFAILELSENAPSNEIKTAYRRKMMEYHPDKVASLGAKLKAIADRETKKLNSAYTMLKDMGYL